MLYFIFFREPAEPLSLCHTGNILYDKTKQQNYLYDHYAKLRNCVLV